MSQTAKPTGIFGKIYARGMALGHKECYKNAAKELNLKEDEEYLEIGFGSGLFINKYAKHAKRISGIDYSNDMVELAGSINKKIIKLGKLELRTGDASSLPWNDNSFNAVAAIETFYFWKEPKLSLQEIYRVLKKDGRLIIEMAFNKDDGKDHKKDIQKMNLCLYSQDEITKLLSDSGFTVSKINYYQALHIPFKGYVVPKGMVVKALKM